jgi:hypothetical protein
VPGIVAGVIAGLTGGFLMQVLIPSAENAFMPAVVTTFAIQELSSDEHLLKAASSRFASVLSARQ